jgi:hypothetical protein
MTLLPERVLFLHFQVQDSNKEGWLSHPQGFLKVEDDSQRTRCLVGLKENVDVLEFARFSATVRPPQGKALPFRFFGGQKTERPSASIVY